MPSIGEYATRRIPLPAKDQDIVNPSLTVKRLTTSLTRVAKIMTTHEACSQMKLPVHHQDITAMYESR